MNLQLEPFFDLSMDCLCIANYDGYFQKINPAFRQLLGYSEEELLSTLIADFIYEEDKERTAMLRENLKKNRPLVNFENRYVCKSGEKVWLQWTSIPLPHEKLIYAIAKDVTFKKELEYERNSQLSHLSKVNSELKQLSYTTSHDLRSPVNNLLSMVDLIDLTKIDDVDTVELLSFIRLSADGLRASLNSFVDVLKQNERLNEKVEEVFFDEILLKVKKAIGTLIRQANTTLNVDFSDLESVPSIAPYMESIFLNLITNAIKFARPDKAPVINVKTTVKNGEKILRFSDNGRGFDMDKVGHRIFNLNQTFHDNEDSKGVGLYLVHNQVTSLGGSIAVNSMVNGGTTFTIKFKL